MVGKLVCSLVGHRVNRRRVKYDDGNFTTRCQRCGAPLVRETYGWRPSPKGS